MMRCLREVNVDNNTVGWRVAAAALLFALSRGAAHALAAAFARQVPVHVPGVIPDGGAD